MGYFRELKALNRDPEARLHLDSNGTILTPDYIDELITEAGVTDIGIEPKGVHPETFMGITGIADEALAQRYLNTAWEAVAHVVENHRERRACAIFDWGAFGGGFEKVAVMCYNCNVFTLTWAASSIWQSR